MSLTALGFIVIYIVTLGLAFYGGAVFGLLGYLWAFFAHPPGSWWGSDLPALRWSLIAGVLTLAAAMLKGNQSAGCSWYNNWGARFLVAYTVWMYIQIPWAVDAGYHREGVILFTKYLLLYYLFYSVITDLEKFRIVALAIVVGSFMFGWEAYRTIVHGRLETVGTAGLDDANLLGVQLLSGLAFAGFLFLGLKNACRWVAFGAIPFIINAIILTESRGVFVALLGSGVIAAWLTPKSARRVMWIVAPLAMMLFVMLAHDLFWDRMSTIRSEEQASNPRVEIAHANWEMFKDHPFGVGHYGNAVLSREYMPEDLLTGVSRIRSAHNSFLAVLVDQGIPGALLFIGIAVYAGITLLRLKRMEGRVRDSRLPFFLAAVGTSLAGCFLGGIFVNFIKGEVQIWLLAMLAALEELYRREIQDNENRPVCSG